MVCALLVMACSDDDAVLEVGVVDFHGESDDVLIAPASVAAGERFVVEVWTYGDGCISGAWLDVDENADGVVLTPYDWRTTKYACTDVLQRLPHDDDIVFESPGEKTITVRGRHFDGLHVDEMIEIEHTLVVREAR